MVNWLSDGTPFSERFGDVYRSRSGALQQAQHVFLAGCDLPHAWQGWPQWRILETGFGLGLNFLATWHAWRLCAQRPRLLHYVSVEAWPVRAEDILRSVADSPALLPLAQSLVAQWHGLSPGFHRLSLEQGQVLLTLCVGQVEPILAQVYGTFDAVYLDGFSPARNPQMWTPAVFQAVAGHSRVGTCLATYTVARSVREGLQAAGFTVGRVPGLAPKWGGLVARYAPADAKVVSASVQPGTAMVIGAGLAGGAVSASLLRRGWQVHVLDAADQPAQGASGVPAALMVPKVSAGGGPLPELVRRGLRMTLQQARELLQVGQDWQASGVLERLNLARDEADDEALRYWTQSASALQRQQAGLAADAPAWWHGAAAWIKPARLVQAWLKGAQWQGNAAVARLMQNAQGQWCACNAAGEVLAQADVVVLAAGYGTTALQANLPLRPLRGQVMWGQAQPQDTTHLPPWPVNGAGFFLPHIPSETAGAFWLSGSTYERASTDSSPRSQDNQAIIHKLHQLLPATATQLGPRLLQTEAWAGIRCASPDRLPWVGKLGPQGPWICSAFGSRGLSFAVLCAELIAAQLHQEPWPLETSLAQGLQPRA